MNDAGASPPSSNWAGVWPDVLAFAAGLGLAWFNEWQTTDLVWSLWLSSLVVGYAMIVWGIFGPGSFLAMKAGKEPALRPTDPKAQRVAAGGVMLAGGLFLLAFFTVHFGMFHFVHSVFLNTFFPVAPDRAKIFPGLALYGEVFRRYWYFLPVAALAERQAFRLAPAPAGPPDTSVQADDIAARKAKAAFTGGGMMAPYKNVLRMHLLIFFFAFAHFAKMENFWVYAAVYAVYFFPWQLGRKREAVSVGT